VRAGYHRGDRGDQDVAVLDVSELVGQDAVDLVGRQLLKQALGDRDRRVLRIAARANAFGCSEGIVYSRGTGSSARRARSSTIASRFGLVPGSTRFARLNCSASRSENQ
jgi:hypothetical protein